MSFSTLVVFHVLRARRPWWYSIRLERFFEKVEGAHFERRIAISFVAKPVIMMTMISCRYLYLGRGPTAKHRTKKTSSRRTSQRFPSGGQCSPAGGKTSAVSPQEKRDQPLSHTTFVSTIMTGV